MNIATIRQITLDTETTGINQAGIYYEGHKIIEIGAIEIINRRLTGNNFHAYLKPNRLVDPEAFSVHGIADEFLLNQPSFSEIADKFLDYIHDAELIIHNASFDIGFLDYEFHSLNRGIPKIDTFCKITDTLALAKKMFPKKRNSLDALCTRYEIDNSKRILHGALLDAQILADVYLAMTSGQIPISFNQERQKQQQITVDIHGIETNLNKLRVILANNEELKIHESYLDLINKKNGNCLWRTRKIIPDEDSDS